MRHHSYGFSAALSLEQRRLEALLAVARAFLAGSALIASSLETARSGQYSAAATPLLGGYVALALAAVLLLHLRPQLWHVPPLAVHAIDALAAAATLWVAGPGAPFFLLFLHTVLAAAYRWGFGETVATAAVAVAALVLEAVLSAAPQPGGFGPLAVQTGRLMTLAALMLLAGVFAGYLAHKENQSRRQTSSIVTILSRVDVRSGLKHTMAAVFDGILGLFDARRALLVVHEVASDRLFMWDVGRSAGAPARSIRSSQLTPGSAPTYMFAPSAAAFHVVRRAGARSDALDVVALDREGARVDLDPRLFPAELLTAVDPFRQLMAFSIDLGGELIGRLFLIDPRPFGDRDGTLGFGERLMQQVGPSVYNVYLLHRLRSRATAIERARLGRELHDGIIQAVMGVQIQLAALSFRVAKEAPGVASDLKRLDGILRQEVVSLRELMQQMRPLDVGPDQLVETLSDLVEQFQRETGIAARFVTQLDRVELPPAACREMARIVQEALVNVRKHSGAKNVLVRFEVIDGECTLLIDDDGRGFAFSGRLSLNDLAKSREGPRVIKERIRLLGGKLTLESAPGRGSRLEIAVPLSIHEIQG